ncbi:hypothetical protein VTH82DRAFT_6100 [Thermothelomyces myriococcoides]
MASNQTEPATTLRPTTSSSSLASTAKPTPTIADSTISGQETLRDEGSSAISAAAAGPARDTPPEYRYMARKQPAGPNPDAQPKHKSRLSRFLAKFQSPAVQQANAARERRKVEEERAGVATQTPAGAPAGSWQSTWAF